LPNSRFNSFKDKIISLSGCPIHYKYLSFVLLNILKENPFILDEFKRPKELYGITVHHGCVRNEYFEWKIDTRKILERERGGVSFTKMGVKHRYTQGSCQ